MSPQPVVPPEESGGVAAPGPLIRLSDVGKTYGAGTPHRVDALCDIDLSIESGEILAIVGPSGSGKSTLLHILGCLDRPSRGEYRLDGRDTRRLSDRELSAIRGSTIGFVFQFFHLLDDETALDNVRLPLLYRGTASREARDRAVAALESVGLGHRLRHRPGELSGGEQQRVAIARALVKKPHLILADEPTGNLDSRSGRQIIETLRAAHARGITLAMITHDEGLARRVPRVIRLEDGRIVADGRPEE